MTIIPITMRAADAAVRFHHACPLKHSLIMHETAFFRPLLFCAHRAMNISGYVISSLDNGTSAALFLFIYYRLILTSFRNMKGYSALGSAAGSSIEIFPSFKSLNMISAIFGSNCLPLFVSISSTIRSLVSRLR